jgi:chemotaxis protein CheX
MRREYINPVIGSTMRVLDSVLQSDITRGDVSLLKGSGRGGEVSIIINVAGESEGTIVVNMAAETALKVYGAMTGDESGSLTSLEMDAISELTNMIAGNAISVLNDLGYRLTVSPPFVFTERGPSDEQPDPMDDLLGSGGTFEVVQIPFFTACGEIDINIAIKKD